MSYNVRVKFETTKGKPPWMDAYDVIKVCSTNGELPEANFVDAVHKEALALVATKVPCGKCKARNDLDAKHCKNCGGQLKPSSTSTRIELKKLWWSGNRAADSLETVAVYVHGRLEAIFVGEDGEVFGGAIIEDGKYTPCRVVMRLVPDASAGKRSP
jgi:ribosomal protein L40E